MSGMPRRPHEPRSDDRAAAFSPWAPRHAGDAGPARPGPHRPGPPAPGRPAPPTGPLAGGPIGPGGPDRPTGPGFPAGSPGPGTYPPADGWGAPPGAPTARPPVFDERRPPGLTPTPPLASPPALLPADHPKAGADAAPGARGRGAFVGLLAFLAGALVVGAAFAAYALGHRADDEGSGGARVAAGGLDVRAILDRAQPSVVSITTGSENSIFGGAGSGVVISEDGLILTNAHVIASSGGTIRVRFHDGVEADAVIVGASKKDDLALVRAERTGLTPATLGSSGNLRVGDDVVAIGNALALGDEPSVTKGIVSAKNRSITDGEISLGHLIQTDAAINPGNSGGPLVNASGEVVGINTAIIDGAQSVGFSIAIDQVKRLLPSLEAGEGDVDPDAAVLGVASVTVDGQLSEALRSRWDVTAESGALITEMDADSAAAESGLQLGDVIVEIDGEPMRTNGEVSAAIQRHKKGDRVRITVERAGDRRTFDVTLGPR